MFLALPVLALNLSAEVTVQGKTVTIPTGDSANAAIDTGTTLIGAPSAAVTAIYAAIPGSQALDSQNLAGFYGYRMFYFNCPFPVFEF